LRLAEALDREISLDFKQQSLGKVAESLQVQLGVPVTIATRTLEDAGVTSETPITFRLSKVRARTALDLMFKSWDMKVLEQEEYLLITTQDKAEESRFSRVYPVGDLVPEELVVMQLGGSGIGGGIGLLDGKPILRPVADYDALIELIFCEVRPQTWDSHQEMVALPTARCLVVIQTREVHDEIAKLLRALRDAKLASETIKIE